MIALGLLLAVGALGIGGAGLLQGQKGPAPVRQAAVHDERSADERHIDRRYQPAANPYRNGRRTLAGGLRRHLAADDHTHGRALFDGDRERGVMNAAYARGDGAHGAAMLAREQFYAPRGRPLGATVPDPGAGRPAPEQPGFLQRAFSYAGDSYRAWQGGIRFPLRTGWRLSSHYGRRKHPLSGRMKQHWGTDLAAAAGSPIYPIMPCEVVAVDDNAVAGLHVECAHPNGQRTRSLHMSRAYVQVGDVVGTEQEIGAVGASGSATGPHLHIELYDGRGRIMNPESVLFGGNVQMT